jgi:hypothetical protein
MVTRRNRFSHFHVAKIYQALPDLDRFFAKSCPSINLYWTQIKFPMQKLAIFRKVKEIKELRGGVQVVRRTSDSAD